MCTKCIKYTNVYKTSLCTYNYSYKTHVCTCTCFIAIIVCTHVRFIAIIVCTQTCFVHICILYAFCTHLYTLYILYTFVYLIYYVHICILYTFCTQLYSARDLYSVHVKNNLYNCYIHLGNVIILSGLWESPCNGQVPLFPYVCMVSGCRQQVYQPRTVSNTLHWNPRYIWLWEFCGKDQVLYSLCWKVNSQGFYFASNFVLFN